MHGMPPPWVRVPVALLAGGLGLSVMQEAGHDIMGWLVAVMYMALGAEGLVRGAHSMFWEYRLRGRLPAWPLIATAVAVGIANAGTPHLRLEYGCIDRGCEYHSRCSYLGVRGIEKDVHPGFGRACPLIDLR